MELKLVSLNAYHRTISILLVASLALPANAAVSCRDIINKVLKVVTLPPRTEMQTEALNHSALKTVEKKLQELPDKELENLQRSEDDVIKVLEKVLINKDRLNQELRTWIQGIENRELSVKEFVSLSYILRSQILENFPDSSALTASADKALRLNWMRISGKKSSNGYLGRLPRSVLSKQDRFTQTYEVSSFESEDGGRYSSRWNAFLNLNNIVQLSIPPSLIVLVHSFSATGGKAMAGLLAGFVLGSIYEHLAHRFIGHNSAYSSIRKIKSDRLRRFMEKTAPKKLLDYLENAYRSHQLMHHGKTVNNSTGGYTKKFKNPEQQKNVEDEFISTYNYSRKRLLETEHGMSLDIQARIAFLAIGFPFHFAAAALTGFDPAFTAGIFLLLPYFQFNSADMHRYMHMTHEQIRSGNTETDHAPASQFMQWYLKTSAMEATARRHYLHHRGRANYNLFPFNIGDWVFGYVREPTLKDFLEMHQLEISGIHEEESTDKNELDP